MEWPADVLWDVVRDLYGEEQIEWLLEAPSRGVAVAYAQVIFTVWDYQTKTVRTETADIFYNPLAPEQLADALEVIMEEAIDWQIVTESEFFVYGKDLLRGAGIVAEERLPAYSEYTPGE